MKNNLINSILVKKPSKSKFDLSHSHSSTMKMGYLYPTLCEPVVPGDTFRISANVFARAQALIAPAFANVKIYTHFFFVPYHLLWDNFDKFLSGGPNGNVFPARPYYSVLYRADNHKGSLADFLGFPSETSIDKVDLMPFKAYQKIYNDYYRDQNLVTEIDLKTNLDGMFSHSTTNYDTFMQLRKRAWSHDYFTSCLPWSQKGPQVSMPISGNISADSNLELKKNVGGNPADGTLKSLSGTLTDVNDNPLKYSDGLTMSGSFSVNDLRTANKLQQFAERLARGGSRYFEMLRSFFGVSPSDETLQRPEYLGGGVQNVLVSQVVQTSSSSISGSTAQGTQAGNMISAGSSNCIKKFIKEYGYIMAITSIMPETNYFQGLPRKYQKWDRFDEYFPQFDNLGEQQINNSEIYYSNNLTQDNTAFGYLPRYAEYKIPINTIHGDFKSSLKYWHLGREFANLPTLSQTFVECTPDSDRIFAVKEAISDPFIVNINFNEFAIRPMSKYSTPIL